MMGDVVSLWGDVMSTPLGDVTSGDAMSLHLKAALKKKTFILRLCYSPYKHNGYDIIKFFSKVDVLGSSSMPQNHYLSNISFLSRSAGKKDLQKSN